MDKDEVINIHVEPFEDDSNKKLDVPCFGQGETSTSGLFGHFSQQVEIMRQSRLLSKDEQTTSDSNNKVSRNFTFEDYKDTFCKHNSSAGGGQNIHEAVVPEK